MNIKNTKTDTELRLIGWGDWVNSWGAGPSYVDSVHRVRKMAPGELTLRGLPGVWVCNACARRILRKQTPQRCPYCSEESIRKQTNFYHGKEKKKHKGNALTGVSSAPNPEAEEIERALIKLPLRLSHLREVAVQRYVYHNTDHGGASEMSLSESRYKSYIGQLHAWLDCYLNHVATPKVLTGGRLPIV